MTESYTIPETWQDASFSQIMEVHKFAMTNSSLRSLHSESELVELLNRMMLYLSRVIQKHDLETIITQNKIYYFISSYSLYLISLDKDSINEKQMINTLTEVHQLLIKKQKDYGPNNILEFGHIGIIIRMFDKIARLTNLISKYGKLSKSANKNSVPNETLIDTLMDIIGYAVIGLMIATPDEQYGSKFKTPME